MEQCARQVMSKTGGKINMSNSELVKKLRELSNAVKSQTVLMDTDMKNHVSNGDMIPYDLSELLHYIADMVEE